MAIRKSKNETFAVKGSIEEWLGKVEQSLMIGEFTSVKTNKTLNQITGNYKKFTVWGEISVTLLPEGEYVKINATSTANVDNIFALFTSPNQRILNQFKNNI
jgi:hypothetical protein